MVFRRNKILITIIAILLTVLIVLFGFFLARSNKDGYSNNPEIIESPYPMQKELVEIDLQENEIEIPKKDKVLKVIGFNSEVLEFFVNLLSNESTDYSKNTSIYLEDDNYIGFSIDYGILSILFKEGIQDLPVINSDEDLKSFFIEYLDIEKISLTNSEESNGGVTYSGQYILKGIAIGSSALNGEAFIIKTNDNGEIINMLLLLIKEESLEEYQYMPLMSLNKLVLNGLYPRMITSNEIEERYYNKPDSYEFKEYFVDKISLMYIFNDSSNGYILPTYKLEGEGLVVTKSNEKYWTVTDLFICAVDPSYLTIQEVSEEKISDEHGVPVNLRD